jgi:HEAT repeat protein
LIATGLDVVESWGKSLNLPEVALLTLHPNLEVRLAAIRSLAFVEASRDTESLILAALDDPNSEVRVAAMQGCLQRRLRSAIPSLQRQLHAGNESCARAACNALAGMGQEGWSILEECVLDPDRTLAAAALGALAAAQLTASSALVTE